MVPGFPKMLHFKAYSCLFLTICVIFLFARNRPVGSSQEEKFKSVSNDAYEGYKAEIGRAAWTFLHTLASKFPQNPTLEEKERYLNFVVEFSKLYPCPECRQDFQKILSRSPPRVQHVYFFISRLEVISLLTCGYVMSITKSTQN